MIKRIISVLCVVVLSIAAFAGCSEKTPSVVLASDGKVMATLTTTEWGRVELNGDNYASYVDAVINEAKGILSEKEKITPEKAASALTTNGYKIETVFDAEIYSSMAEGHSFIVDNMAATITDLSGKVLAIYSVCDEENIYRNLALTSFYPCSAFKPLSVYAPAIEAGKLNWSTMTEDSPLKKIQGEGGIMRDWPSNASGKYTNANMDIKTAVKESINTVAVKSLMSYGVKNSMEFLQSSFGIDVSYELQQIGVNGDDSVLDNIALGYLTAGVNTIDMAGYYQIFANEGIYTKPYTISKITDGAGDVIYEAEPKGIQVISRETAAIMNYILQEVVKKGGTGEAAGQDGRLLGGKTGTGVNPRENWNDNWFVGFTPEYTCAVWHSAKMTSNVAAALFAEITYGVEVDENATFPYCENVKQVAYCTESGKRIGDKCKGMEIGWFLSDDVPERCEDH